MTTMSEEGAKTENNEKTRWREVLYDFTQNTTIHALKQITEPTPFTFRRILWILVLILGLVAFIMQVTESIIYYMSNPVAVNILINYNDTLRFPAITICNQNAFRMTKAAENDYYSSIENIYGHSGHLDGNKTPPNYDKLLSAPLSQIYTDLAHKKEDFIVSCEWEQKPCSAKDFEQTLTDHGICYTFNNEPNMKSIKNATQTGALWGLRMRLNVEQYEYMMGPKGGAGVRVLVHQQKDFALVGDFGQSVPPGTHAFLGIMIVEIHDLPKPHGLCQDDVTLKHFEQYTQTSCIRECKQKMVLDYCGCMLGTLPQHLIDNPLACTLNQTLTCVKSTLDTFPEYRDKCHCPYPCDRTHFDNDITYGDMSTFDMEKIMNDNLTQLEKRYAYARETAQIVKTEIVMKDHTLAMKLEVSVGAISKILSTIPTGLNSMLQIFNDDANKFKQRIWFHLESGLKKVEYVAKHDFVRGWEIVEERTFNHVATGFWEIISSYDRALELLESTYSNATVTQRELMFYNIDDRLFNRLTMAQRALINLTEVNNAYKTGDPLLKFRVTLNRRYDLYFIPIHLFNLTPKTREKYYGNAEISLTNYTIAIQAMRKCGKLLAIRNITSCPNVLEHRDQFIRAAKMINYNLFQFRTKVLDNPSNAVADIIKHFEQKNETLWAEYNFLTGLIDKVKLDIAHFANTTWRNIKTASQMFTNYTKYRTISKSSLGDTFNSILMDDNIIALKMFFQNLRSRAREIKDSSQRLRELYIDVFQVMAKEQSTKPVYKKIFEDVEEYFQNPANQSVYIKQFAEISGKSEEHIASQSRLPLMMLMNADFTGMNVSATIINIMQFFANELLLKTQIDETINNLDEILSSNLLTIRGNLAKFTASTKINYDFFRENYLNLDIYMRALSYEGITQQIAYDMTNLWSDIGGSIGLFIGASAISVFEILDIFVHTAMKVGHEKHKKKNNKERANHVDYNSTPHPDKKGWMFTQKL